MFALFGSLLGFVGSLLPDILATFRDKKDKAHEMLKGEVIPDPEDGKLWKAALLKGGGLGVYGDFLFQEYSRYGHTLLTESAESMMGMAADIFALYSDAKDGRWDKVKQEGLKMLKRNIPGQNLFYLELALAVGGIETGG